MTTLHTSEMAMTRPRHQRRPRPASSAVIERWEDRTYMPGDAILEPLRADAARGHPNHWPIPDTLQYPGAPNTVEFFFWSITDGFSGNADGRDREDFWWTASGVSATMTAIAWYGPPHGGGNGPPGPPDIMIDAYSVVAGGTGGFLDNDFVTVTSDPSLTDQANQDGWVPTTSAETLQAVHSIGDTLAFHHWEVQDAGTVAEVDLTVPAGSTGTAIAVYVPNGVTVNPPPGPPQFIPQAREIGDPARLLQALSGDQGPLAPLIQRLATNDAIRGLAGGLSSDAAVEIGKLLDADATAALNEAQAPPKVDSIKGRKKQK